MAEFTRDPNHWLRKLSPDEWIRAGLRELQRASAAYETGNIRAGAAGVKRAAGMALNGALLVAPNVAWGRTYVEHVEALAKDAGVPEAVSGACRIVLEAGAPSHGVVLLRTPRTHAAVLEATKDVIAHAWAVVKKQG
jgi:hypothetical protein